MVASRKDPARTAKTECERSREIDRECDASHSVESLPAPDSLRKLGALFGGGCLALGFLSSAVSGSLGREQWYDGSTKPVLWPPQWVFPAAWVGNYTLMGAATARIWQQRDHPAAHNALTLFAVHFLFTLAFLPIVNRVRKRAVYVGMDVAGATLAAATTLAYARVSPPAARTLLPYLTWCGFTTLIKIQWWRME